MSSDLSHRIAVAHQLQQQHANSDMVNVNDPSYHHDHEQEEHETHEALAESSSAVPAIVSQKFKKAPDAPKRFKSAFIIFSAEKHRELKEVLAKRGRSEKTTEIAKMVSESWREMPAEEKEGWEQKARKDKARYEVEKSMYKGPWKVPANRRTPKDPSAPKRPMSAFLAFSNKRRAALKRQHPDASNSDLSKMLSKTWKEAPDELRLKYMDEEAALRSRYKVEMGKWRKKVAEEKKAERKEREAFAMQAAEARSSGTATMFGTHDQNVNAAVAAAAAVNMGMGTNSPSLTTPNNIMGFNASSSASHLSNGSAIGSSNTPQHIMNMASHFCMTGMSPSNNFGMLQNNVSTNDTKQGSSMSQQQPAQAASLQMNNNGQQSLQMSYQPVLQQQQQHQQGGMQQNLMMNNNNNNSQVGSNGQFGSYNQYTNYTRDAANASDATNQDVSIKHGSSDTGGNEKDGQSNQASTFNFQRGQQNTVNNASNQFQNMFAPNAFGFDGQGLLNMNNPIIQQLLSGQNAQMYFPNMTVNAQNGQNESEASSQQNNASGNNLGSNNDTNNTISTNNAQPTMSVQPFGMYNPQSSQQHSMMDPNQYPQQVQLMQMQPYQMPLQYAQQSGFAPQQQQQLQGSQQQQQHHEHQQLQQAQQSLYQPSVKSEVQGQHLQGQSSPLESHEQQLSYHQNHNAGLQVNPYSSVFDINTDSNAGNGGNGANVSNNNHDNNNHNNNMYSGEVDLLGKDHNNDGDDNSDDSGMHSDIPGPDDSIYNNEDDEELHVGDGDSVTGYSRSFD